MRNYIIALTAVLLVVGALLVPTETPGGSKQEREVTLTTPKKDTTPPVSKVKVRRLEVEPVDIILFNVQVNYQSVQLTLARLEELRLMGRKEVYIVLDSPGGSVIDGAELVSYIKSSGMTINTVCNGICASMAAQLHQSGKKRFMAEKSLLMFHPASGGVRGTLEQMLSQLKTIKLYVDRMDQEAVSRSKITYEEFRSLVADEIWLEGVDAIRLGFSDELVLLLTKSNGDGEIFYNLRNKVGGKPTVNNLKGVRSIQ